MKLRVRIFAQEVATASASRALDVCVGIVRRAPGGFSSLFVLVAVTVLALAPAPASG